MWPNQQILVQCYYITGLEFWVLKSYTMATQRFSWSFPLKNSSANIKHENRQLRVFLLGFIKYIISLMQSFSFCAVYGIYRFKLKVIIYILYAAKKVSVFGIILVRIFPHFHFVSLRIQSECGKMWTIITPNTGTFNAVTLAKTLYASNVEVQYQQNLIFFLPFVCAHSRSGRS